MLRTIFILLKTVFILMVILVLIALVTNPGPESHRREVKDRMRQKLDELIAIHIKPKDAWQEIALGIGESVALGLLENKVDAAVSADNYYLFSITNVTIENNTVAIGIGAFGNVWLITDAPEVIDLESLAAYTQ